MGYETIHETAIKTIVDNIVGGISNGINAVDKTFNSKSNSVAYSSSITKATKGLVMEFPVLVSKSNHIESAGIVAKAYEAKFVTLLHLAFAACGIADEKNGNEFLRSFHTNIDKKISVDDFIDIMDGIANESTMTADTYAMYRAVTEDMRKLSYCFGDDIEESSLGSYKIFNTYGSVKVVKEELDGRYNPNDDVVDKIVKDKREKEKLGYERQNAQLQKDKFNYQKDRDAEDFKLRLNKDTIDQNKDRRDQEKFERDIITNYLLPSEIKKANELTPTMMIVNFKTVGRNKETINQQMVVGVKAKLYEVEPMDVINKLITKNVDSNILLKLIKVSTREISFAKDFLFAIDSAKTDALSSSKRGSTNKLFKVLERRAIGSKIRKTLKLKDYSKAISSLVISQEEVEELLKNNIDVSNPAIIRPIMEKLNLISFAIIDESSESVKFLFDTGDDTYETIPFSKLEREQRDGMSKKVINLIAKMNR